MTLRLVYDNSEGLLKWAAGKIEINKFRSDAQTIGMEKDGQIVAVVVYDTFSPNDCCMHIASDGSALWLNKSLLVAAFAYPFIQCEFMRVTGLVDESNSKALKFDKHLGFKEEGRLRKGMPNGDAIIIMGMLREECRFIPARCRV